jgi:hypothetical protein
MTRDTGNPDLIYCLASKSQAGTILYTSDDIPVFIKDELLQGGFLKIRYQVTHRGERSNKDFMYVHLLRPNDILYVPLLSWNAKDYPKIKTVFIRDQSLTPAVESQQEMTKQFSNMCYECFKSGYIEGLSNFEKELRESISPLEYSENNIKNHLFRLRDEWARKTAYPTLFSIQKLKVKGKYHGLYSSSLQVMKKHGWAEEKKEYTHREYLIAHACKVEIGKAKHLTAKEMRQVSEKRYQASLTLNKSKKETYRAPKMEELRGAIRILQKECPEAQKLAQQALDSML